MPTVQASKVARHRCGGRGLGFRRISHRSERRHDVAPSPVCAAAAEDVAQAADASPAEPVAGTVPDKKLEKLQLAAIGVGQELKGKVTSLAGYGCFVDIGAETDGLVHISEVSSGFVSDVSEVVSSGQEVTVRVLSVDAERNRIALTMKQTGDAAGGAEDKSERREAPRRAPRGGRQASATAPDVKPGDVVSGSVVRTAAFGAFVRLDGTSFDALIPRSEMQSNEEEGDTENPDPRDLFQSGQRLEALVVLNVEAGKIALTPKSSEDRELAESLEMGGMSTGAGDPETDGSEGGALVGSLLGLGIDLASLPSKGGAAAPQADAALSQAAATAAAVPEGAAEPGPHARAAAVADIARDVAPVDIPEVTADLGGAVLDAAAPVVTSAPDEARGPVPEPPLEASTTAATEPPVAAESPSALPESPPVVADAAPSGPDEGAVPESPPVAAEGTPVPAPVEGKAILDAPMPDAPSQVASEEEAPAPQGNAATPEMPPVAAAVLPGPPESEAAPIVPGATEASSEPASAASVVPANSTAAPDQAAPLASAVKVPAALVKQLREATGAGMMDAKKALVASGADMAAAKEWLRVKGLASAAKKAGRVAAEGAVMAYIHGGARLGALVEVNCETDFVARSDEFKEFAENIAMQVAASPDVRVVSPEDVPKESLDAERAVEMGKEDVQSTPEEHRAAQVDKRVKKFQESQALLSQPFIRADDGASVEAAVQNLTVKLGEKVSVRRFVRYELGEGLEKRADDFAAEVAAQTEKKAEVPAPAPEEERDPGAAEVPAVKVEAQLVKQLRDATGAGMMSAKEALVASNNDMEAAQVWLKKKGLASAGKKAGRLAADGIIEAYVHAGNAKGVLLELNCETDFVARGDVFKELASDLAMQVVAYEDVQYVASEDVPESFKEAELAAELQKEDLLAKPENVRGKIAEGRVVKTVAQMCLLDQPFIKDPKKTVGLVITEAIAALGENIRVRRFERFNLGEGIDKKSADFAAEVAAQTGQAV